jgi:folate-binding protein YgfZ
MAEKPYYTTLKNRGTVTVSGPDRRTFLQGLISNDINLLDTQPCVYACLLNAQGKFLHDFFITERDSIITLECEGGERAIDLHKKLSMYTLRADVKIDHQENVAIYSIPSSPGLSGGSTNGFPASAGNDDNGIYPDPRHEKLGFRAFKKPAGEERDFDEWDRLRISLTIPDGSRDLVVGNSALDEGHIDKLNGISYEKGCYIGQELTARMHYRSLGKKHLYTVSGELLRNPGEPIEINGKIIGEMRSICGDIGLALLKDEFAQ